jgi:heat shock protein HslJ
VHAAWLAVALPLSGCSGDSGHGVDVDVDVAGSWVLVSGRTADGPLAITEHTHVTLSLDEEGAGGKAPCNDYGSGYEVDGTSFELTGDGISRTLMGCGEDPEALESAYLGALGGIDTVARDGDTLTMTGEDVELELRLDAPWPRADVVGRTWRLHSWTDESGREHRAAQEAGRLPFVRFDESGPHGGRITASNGCRTTTGRWREWHGAPTITRSTASGTCGAVPTDQEVAAGTVLGEPVLELRTTGGRPELVLRHAHANSPAEVVYRR